MIDATTHQPLRVSGVGIEWPYIDLPFSQLDAVRRLFDEHGLRFSVDDDIISLDDGPYIATISLGRAANVEVVQAILDSVR